MADTINKPSIQIRSGLPSPLSDKSPSPATKLLISHGKPNFTIPRSPKDEDNVNPLSPQAAANNNYNPYKCANNNNNNNKFVVGTKFNGVFKPSTVLANGNGNAAANSESNEAAKVVLRRAKPVEPLESLKTTAGEDDNVPEFILRQRRIQERLAKENVLDFESRRSGYFTHVMISPDSPNRTSFVETMASPAIVPSLEMPLPARIEEEEQHNGHSVEQVQESRAVVTNGHTEHEKEEEQKHEEVKHEEVKHEEKVQEEMPSEAEKEHHVEHHEEQQEKTLTNGHAHKDHEQDVAPEDVANAIEEVNKAVAGEEDDESKPEPEHVVEEVKVTPSSVEAKVEVVTPIQPEESITISHTNGHSTEVPHLPTPDPSGALGVNYEPKTVVSFSQELGSGENNYPDTVQVVKDAAAPTSPVDAQMQELSKLKFDIQNDAQNGEVSVTPVLRAE